MSILVDGNTKATAREKITLKMLPNTVNRPLSAQAQATAPCGHSRMARIPNGNGMPRKNAEGKIIRAAVNIRTGNGEARNCDICLALSDGLQHFFEIVFFNAVLEAQFFSDIIPKINAYSRKPTGIVHD